MRECVGDGEGVLYGREWQAWRWCEVWFERCASCTLARTKRHEHKGNAHQPSAAVAAARSSSRTCCRRSCGHSAPHTAAAVSATRPLAASAAAAASAISGAWWWPQRARQGGSTSMGWWAQQARQGAAQQRQHGFVCSRQCARSSKRGSCACRKSIRCVQCAAPAVSLKPVAAAGHLRASPRSRVSLQQAPGAASG